MELLLALGAIIVLDVLALELGSDSRERHPLEHHDRALDALKHGDLERYREEIARMERDIARNVWRPYQTAS
ncbi:MAG TPA: hypothetical protein VFC31_10650 [Candidatus Limnocylindria bacterium]|nr:hypothetical protein [Candidatus Limnocylindria bacterium]